MSKLLTTVSLSRYKTDKMGLPTKLLERKTQPSRSFTIGLLDQLYTSFAKIGYSAPYSSAKSIDKVLIDLSNYEFSSYNQAGVHANLQVAAPGGNSAVFPYVVSTAGLTYLYQMTHGTKGCDLGIQVGTDNTAVTPLDRRLVKRIGHGTRAADGVAVVFEEYPAGDDQAADINSAATWLAQGFTPLNTHQLSSVLIKIYKAGSPGILNVRIRGADTNGSSLVPTSGVADDLAAGTIAEASIPAASPGALTECTFATPVTVYAGRRYFIVIDCPGAAGAAHVYWRYDDSSPTYRRNVNGSLSSYCQRGTSGNFGSTWTLTSDKCYLFQEKGQSVGDFVHGGTEVRALAVANPNASFVIQKYFYNGSGGSISVAEVGIHAVGYFDNSTNAHETHPMLIARDVVAPAVAVANTELLVVTYTPSIIV